MSAHRTIKMPGEGQGTGYQVKRIDANMIWKYPQDLSESIKGYEEHWPHENHQTSEELFTYDELPASWIRLAKIHRSGRIDFKAFQLHKDMCPYVAVSYCWGPGNPSGDGYSEHVDGRKVPVRGAVKTIIDRILLEYEECIVWIDGICINQANLEEKTAQVALMGQVYSLAKLTLAWLGEADRATEFQFQLTNRKWLDTTDYRVALERWAPSGRLWEYVNPFSYEEASVFALLLDRAYFQRLWIVQEILMSKHIVIWCGSYKTVWEKFAAVVTDLRIGFPNLSVPFDGGSNFLVPEHMKSTNLPIHKVPSGFLFVPFLRIWRRRFIQEHEEGGSFLARLKPSVVLSAMNTYAATDPRDKIFAPLCLTRTKLPISYTQTVEEVYYIATKELLRSELVLLGLAGSASKRNLDLPSWVPDFSVQLGFSHWSTENKGFFRAGVSAEGAMPPKIKVDDNRVLTLPGIIVDEIREVFSPSTAESGTDQSNWYEHANIPPMERFMRLIDMMSARAGYPTGSTCMDILHGLFLRGAEDVDIGKDGPNEKIFDEWVLDMQKRREIIRNQRQEGDSFNENELKKWFLESDFHAPMKKLITASGFGLCRWPFITDKGYLGLGLDGIKAGDMVCVFDTATVPFVIRKGSESSENMYSLVCEANIHGIMQGEAMNMGQWEDVRLK